MTSNFFIFSTANEGNEASSTRTSFYQASGDFNTIPGTLLIIISWLLVLLKSNLHKFLEFCFHKDFKVWCDNFDTAKKCQVSW